MKFAYFIIGLFLFSSCSPSTYFRTPNEMQLILGTVLLKNGKELEGKINANIRSNKANKNYIKVTQSENSKSKEIQLSEISEVRIRNVVYVPKTITYGLFERPFTKLLKRITPAGNVIELYEDEKITTTTDFNNNIATNNSYTNYIYYVQFPNEDECLRADGKYFQPDFDDKVSSRVKDCSSLAKKIKNKEKDFYYPVIHSVDREINVWQNISSQYQKCKE
jgi:hypothetical protein